MNPSPAYHPPPTSAGASPFPPSPPLSQSNPGVIGEPSVRHHGIESKGEFLLQLLQGGGGGGGGGGGRMAQHNANGDRVGEQLSPLGDFPHSMGVEDLSAWQLRDPAVAALGPSHSFHAGGELPSQLLQPNPLFMPPQYGGFRAGGGWTSQQQPTQQQQHPHHPHHQFFPPSLDPRGYGGLHPRGPHQVPATHFPPYPPPPPAQSPEQSPWMVDDPMLEFSRRPEAPWLPPPHIRQGMNDSAANARAWGGSMQGSVLKTPLPPPLPPPPTPPSQQFYGDGAELLQLLLGGGSRNSETHNAQKSTAKSGVIDAGSGEDVFGKGLSGGIQVGNVIPRTQGMIVHGPIGPPKRAEATQPAQSPPGAEDLLGRFWAASNPLASGSPEPNKVPKSGLTPGQDVHPCDFSHSGAHAKESLNLSFDSSKLQQQQQQQQQPVKYEYFGGQPKPGVLKPPGFSGERDHVSGLPVESNFFSPAAKALPQSLDFQGGGGDGGLRGVWDSFQEGASNLKQEHTGRPSEDRGHHHTQQHPSSHNVSGRNREERYQGVPVGSNGDTPTSMAPADLSGTSKENENNASRELARLGGRGSGRRGGPGRGEVGRWGGRMVTGQWVAVNERQRERESDREGVTTGSLVEAADVPAERGGSNVANMNATTTSPSTPQAGNSPPPGKEDSPNSLKETGSGGKLRDEMKRRRGQTQEWRMKQASPPQSKASDSPASVDSPSQEDMHSAGILPLASQVDHPGLPSNMVRHSMPGSAMDESKDQLHHQLHEGSRNGGRERAGSYGTDFEGNGRPAWEDGLGREEEEDLMRDFSGYAKLVEDADQAPATPPRRTSLSSRAAQEESESEGRHENLRDSREVRRPQQQRTTLSTMSRGDLRRPDLEAFNPQLLVIYKDLIPSQEEVQKRRKFLGRLDSLVSRDWAGAKLFLFGSCANDFGVCNSDIDICLSVDDESSKAELVMKMAGILRSDNMQNVQALTHARVPIVKFTDPDSGINCDICVNNMLAVVNSKLLHDYSQIDPRLRQLAFLVKHWAKRRQVNETYRGTLSSYAYVLMCIHFLQQRKPAILPCLQDMQPTYQVIVGKIKCAYYDKIDTLKNFGARNKELVGELLTAFFEYWAFRHDYNHSVISVRTGGYLSKDEKDWTRRIGNERHLICIEDPFEVAHDLGRVVDRHSIRVLRDEFNRAAKILRQDPNPATALFEPFIRDKPQ